MREAKGIMVDFLEVKKWMIDRVFQQLFRRRPGIKWKEVGEVVQREASLRVLGPEALGHGLAEGREVEDSPLPEVEEQAGAWKHRHLFYAKDLGDGEGTQEERGEVRDEVHQGRVGKFRHAEGPRQQRHLDQRGCDLRQSSR